MSIAFIKLIFANNIPGLEKNSPKLIKTNPNYFANRNIKFFQLLDVDTAWSVSSIDDTWLLVLVASSIGVLLLGALLAMFLLKCRE